jgi:DNA mismatch repair protein MutH
VVTLGGTIGVLAGRDGVNWETNAVHLLLAVVVGWVGFEGGKRRPT